MRRMVAIQRPLAWKTETARPAGSMFRSDIDVTGAHVAACEPEPRTILFASESAYGAAGRPEPSQTLWWVGRFGRGKFRGRCGDDYLADWTEWGWQNHPVQHCLWPVAAHG